LTSILAHRGSVEAAPENSLDAVRAAAALGADGVELDVRRTADGCVVLHHDLEASGLGPVSGLRRSDLPPQVPTLDDALALCASLGLDVNVEVKSELAGPHHDPAELCARASAALCAQAQEHSRIVISSFSIAALAAVRESADGLALAWLLWHDSTEPAPWSQGVLGTLGLEGVHPYDTVVDAAYLRRAHNDGLAVRVWPVSDPDRIAQLGELGVDAVITNDVPAALKALGRA
jgi:glycerophosphoryl diester phosphodiesterase